MVVREYKYKGYNLEQLQKMSYDEFKKIVPSRVKRSMERGIVYDKKITNALESLKKGEILKKPVKTHKRDIIIMPNMVGLKVAVYNGKSFETITINPEMICHYLGEFVVTRKRPSHSKAGIGATRSSKNSGKK